LNLKKRLYVVFSIIGLLIVVFGAFLYVSYFGALADDFEPRFRGFGVIGNYTDDVNSDVKLQSLSLTVIRADSFKVHLLCDFIYRDLEDYTYTFIVVLPFQITNLLYASENIAFQNTPEGSALVVSFCGVENSAEFKWSRVTAYFTVEQTFQSSNRGSYTMFFLFSGGINDTFYEDLKNQYGVYYSIGTAPFILRVSLPKGYILTTSFPQVSRGPNHWDNPITNETIVTSEWSFESLNLLNDVTVNYQNSNEISHYECMLFSSGLLLGIGIPLIVTSIYDWARDNERSKG
jgi:hypothetical protein